MTSGRPIPTSVAPVTAFWLPAKAKGLALKGSNLSFPFKGVNKLVLDVSKSVTEPQLTIYQCPANPLGETALYLRGGMNGWNADPEYAFTYSCDAFYLNLNASGDLGSRWPTPAGASRPALVPPTPATTP